MVTASFDGTAKVHRVLGAEVTGSRSGSRGRDTGLHFEDLCTLEHPGRVLQARFHPHRPVILTCTANSDVKIWI